MAVFVVQAAVLNMLLVGCKLVQQVVAAFLTHLQMIAIRDSIRLHRTQGGNQMSSNLASYVYPGPSIPRCEPSSNIELYRLTKLELHPQAI